MASQRAVSSVAKSAAAFRPAATVFRAASTQRCAAAGPLSSSRTLSTSTAALSAPIRLAVRSPAVGRGALSAAQRWYSAEPAQTKLWSFDEIQKQLETNEDKNVIFVDVREPAELRDTGKIPGAINIPITSAVQSLHIPAEEFEELHGYERPDKDKTLVFYCKAGVRAKTAAGLAMHAGWTNVGEYRGSWIDWAQRDGPVEKVKGGQ